ncbi:hypothetical protein C8A05DRAFT_35544 [Staphylotrichum tortipilum]|uniref:Uncharacterized protein n=1 Tax=Staphylotrichum tortipilum TaxID=2831512 RepID=A0AAN6MIF3_9PEZI|nr:hypothetical protein C8A05DRAFT_35544 [Staphylotrichum longicolle]
MASFSRRGRIPGVLNPEGNGPATQPLTTALTFYNCDININCSYSIPTRANNHPLPLLPRRPQQSTNKPNTDPASPGQSQRRPRPLGSFASIYASNAHYHPEKRPIPPHPPASQGRASQPAGGVGPSRMSGGEDAQREYGDEEREPGAQPRWDAGRCQIGFAAWRERAPSDESEVSERVGFSQGYGATGEKGDDGSQLATVLGLGNRMRGKKATVEDGEEDDNDDDGLSMKVCIGTKSEAEQAEAGDQGEVRLKLRRRARTGEGPTSGDPARRGHQFQGW